MYMIPLYTIEQFAKAKSRDILPLQCKICHGTFYVKKNRIQGGMKGNVTNTYDCCSFKCAQLGKITKRKTSCKQCGKDFFKTPCQIKRTKNDFCSQSCACLYNNSHKTTGTRRSKLECWIEKQLDEKYPDIDIDYNKTNAINAELDIYIPSLKLAFEMNGIFHYEPIYSENKLDKTRTNDRRKFQACLDKKIELCVIDTSSQTYFKEKSSTKFLRIITNIIDDKLVSLSGYAPDPPA